MIPDLFVLSVEAPDGERFAIVRTDEFFLAARSQWASPENWMATLEQRVRTSDLLKESSVRARLEEMGFDDDEVADHVARARKARSLNQNWKWERVTRVGYRNEDGQEVVAKTNRIGSEHDQRVFRMRCSVCGHEYGTNGCDIPHRCCPNCQDGPPGFEV